MSNTAENTSDIMDDALESYFLTDEFKKQHKEIDEMIAAFSEYLGPALLPKFQELLNTIDNANANLAAAVFQLGYECKTACETTETN